MSGRVLGSVMTMTPHVSKQRYASNAPNGWKQRGDAGSFAVRNGARRPSGEAVSAEAVKSHIRGLIAAEAADSILSDDQLVEMLRAQGFDIARRTVAKYREAIGIGSSVQRRRQKAIGSHAA